MNKCDGNKKKATGNKRMDTMTLEEIHYQTENP